MREPGAAEEELMQLLDAGTRAWQARAWREAHERWEDAWNAAPPESRRFCQGLAQLAAALVLVEDGRLAGARRVARRALRKLAAPPPPGCPVSARALRAEWERRGPTGA